MYKRATPRNAKSKSFTHVTFLKELVVITSVQEEDVPEMCGCHFKQYNIHLLFTHVDNPS
jgi:hypothetical protein